MTAPNARARYLADAVATATPARRLVMLFDRLFLDVQRGQSALASGNPGDSREHVSHAQLIVAELMGTLDLTAWDGADNLAAIYGFTLNQLTDAIVKPTPGCLDVVVGIIGRLRDAWTQAELSLSGSTSDVGAPAGAGTTPPRPVAWVG